MTVTPTGFPPWTKTSDHSTYGGDLNKKNYQSQGAVNPLTDVTAEQFTRLAYDVAAMARTAAFATLRVTTNDTSPAAPTIEFINQMTGVRTASYEGDSAPTGFPSAVRNGNGDVTITWDASYADAYSVTGNLGLKFPLTTLEGTTGGAAIPEIVSDVAIRVRCIDTSAAAMTDATFILEVA